MLILALVLTFVSVSVSDISSVDGDTSESTTYKLSNGLMAIEEGGNLTIKKDPDSSGSGVLSTGKWQSSTIETLTVGEGVTEISATTFRHAKITNLIISDSVKKIMYRAIPVYGDSTGGIENLIFEGPNKIYIYPNGCRFLVNSSIQFGEGVEFTSYYTNTRDILRSVFEHTAYEPVTLQYKTESGSRTWVTNFSQISGQTFISTQFTNYKGYYYKMVRFDPVQLEYRLNDGSWGQDIKIETKSPSYSIPEEVPTKQAYEFRGWKCGDRVFEAGQSIELEKDLKLQTIWTPSTYRTATLEAVWEPAIHGITYDLKGGTGDFPSQEIQEGERFVIPATTPTKDGASFGWWSDGTTEYMPGDTGTMGVSSIRLAAVWTHRVVYDLDGGSGEPPATQQIPEEQGFEVSSAVPFRGGYAFRGWSDGTTTYQPGADATMGKSDIVLTAVWDRSVIPIFPDDQDDPIEVIVEKESEPRLGKDAKNVLLIAIAVAIIAELAVLSISRRRRGRSGEIAYSARQAR